MIVGKKMQIHTLFYETLAKIPDMDAEGISRGITHGHAHEYEGKIAVGILSDIENKIRELERVRFEFDTEDQINAPEDLKWMRVSVASLAELIAKRSPHEEDMIRGFIFHEALFRKIGEVREWARKYKVETQNGSN